MGSRVSSLRVILALLCAAPLIGSPALAQRQDTPTIGVLWHAATPQEEAIYAEPMRQGFADLGYVENRDYKLIETYAAEKYENFAANTDRLIKAKVDVIIAVTGPAATAAQRATSTIPIVFLVVPDPVGRGMAKSLSRPGGNLTGLSTAAVELSSKRLEQLKAAIPDLKRVGLFVNPKDPSMSRAVEDRTRSTAQNHGVSIEVTQIDSAQDLSGAFETIKTNAIPAIVFMQDPLFFNERKQIAKLGLSNRVATMVANGLMVREGCLISYGPNFPAQFRRVASFVDKILKGHRPAEIPIEEPTRLELVLNLKTAEALGLAIPAALLAQADEVID